MMVNFFLPDPGLYLTNHFQFLHHFTVSFNPKPLCYWGQRHSPTEWDMDRWLDELAIRTSINQGYDTIQVNTSVQTMTRWKT